MFLCALQRITSAGRRVSLVKLFQQALRGLGVDGSVYAVDLQPHAPAIQVADGGETLPSVTDVKYLDYLLEYCKANQIRLVVPTIDTELHILSSAKERFEAEGILLLVCSDEVNNISLDKRNTQQFFQENHALFSTLPTLTTTRNSWGGLITKNKRKHTA